MSCQADGWQSLFIMIGVVSSLLWPFVWHTSHEMQKRLDKQTQEIRLMAQELAGNR